MKKYVCDVCGYIYDEEIGDPDNGIEAGTKWEDVPEDFLCPLCGVGKDEFSEVEYSQATATYSKERERRRSGRTTKSGLSFCAVM